MKLKIDRLEYENLEEDIDRKKEKEMDLFPDKKKEIDANYRDLKNFEIIPADFIQDYLDDMSRLGWILIQVVPIYYPVRATGREKLFGIDYYWQRD